MLKVLDMLITLSRSSCKDKETSLGTWQIMLIYYGSVKNKLKVCGKIHVL